MMSSSPCTRAPREENGGRILGRHPPQNGDDSLLVYFAVFAIPAVIGLLDDRRYPRDIAHSAALFLYGLFITCVVGLRYNVGADWAQYEYFFAVARFEPISRALQLSDPGYMLLNVVVARLGGSITGVMLVSAAIIAYSLVKFSTLTPYPWIALGVAASHFTVVMSMSHVRQSVALACILIAVVALAERSIGRYVVWCVLAAVFHRSAVIFIPVAALLSDRNRYVVVLAVACTVAASYFALLQGAAELYRGRYIASEYAAYGGAYRVMMNVPAALLFLLIVRRHVGIVPLRRFWAIMSVLAFMFVILYALVPSSAAVDRLAKYALPLQFYAMAWLAAAGGGEIVKRYLTRAAVLGCYGAYLYVWLSYSTLAAAYWIPYNTVLGGK